MAAAPQGRIFISYRRQETAWPARQLYEVMISRFGADQVFKDVDNINPGDDFVERLTQAVGSCDILLALIGRQWLEITDATGQRRIDDPADFVRLEIATALGRGVRVIPILVDGAAMPRAESLPEDLVALSRRQAVPLDPVTFDTSRLLATIGEILTPPAAASPPTPIPGEAQHSSPRGEPTPVSRTPARSPAPAWWDQPRRRLILAVAGVVAAAVVSGALAFAWFQPRLTSAPPPTTSGQPATTGQPATQGATQATAAPPVTTSPIPSASASKAPSPPKGGPLAVMAHRGGQEVHQLETQQAMEAAARDGYSVETDVRYTSDGVAVLVHDEQATKGLDCGGKEVAVSKTSWKVLRATCRSTPTAADRRSYPIPTYPDAMEAIAAASPTAWVFVEVKADQSDAQARDFVGVLTAKGLRERAVVTSVSRDRLAKIRAIDKNLPTLLFISGSPIPASTLSRDRLWGVAVEQGVASKGYVAQLRAEGLKVVVWLLNDPRQWVTARDIKADVVMTDYPAKYTAWFATQPAG